MRNEPMRRNELPETCFSILPVSFSLRVRFEQVIVPGQFDAA